MFRSSFYVFKWEMWDQIIFMLLIQSLAAILRHRKTRDDYSPIIPLHSSDELP